MAPNESYTSSMQSVSSAYRGRAENLAASEEADQDAVTEADTLEHDTHDLTEEQKFVGGVDVKKDAESEEDFLPTPDAEADDSGDGDDDTEPADEDLPKESWKRDDIVKYLVDHEVIEDEKDVEGQTKAQLIDNFVG